MSKSFDRLFRIPTFATTIGRMILVGLFLLASLGGCAIPKVLPPASVTPDRAFITYSPAPADNKKLRLAVKDNIDMKGVVTSAGSQFLATTRSPAKRDAKCLAIARQRGVHVVGRTNTSEFAVAVSGINAYYGTPRNPLNKRLIPGGSSSGAAVAVANGEADVALGTDTAGSIRIPAACCGIVGLKTTFGLVPIAGVYPIAPKKLDTIGPMARNVAGVVEGMDLLESGFSARYHEAVAAKPSAKEIRVGRLYIDGTDPHVDRAVDEALTATGFTVVKLTPAFMEKWIQAQKDGSTVAAVGAWLQNNKVLIAPLVALRTKTIVALGGVEYTTTYPGALQRQAKWKAEIHRMFQQVDFIALPTMKTVPSHLPFFGNSVAIEAQALASQNTQAVNFAGVPALAIPVPIRKRSIPVTSLQLVGPSRSEAGLLNAGRLIEAAQVPRER